MKSQSSLVATLLVILESIAVVGFLFLIFAASSGSNVGKYQYDFQVINEIGASKGLANAVVSMTEGVKKQSFTTNEEGRVTFRTRTPLTQVQVSANDYMTKIVQVNAPVEETIQKEMVILEKNDQDPIASIKAIKPLQVLTEDKKPITNAIVTLQSETPARTIQYEAGQGIYPLTLSNTDKPVQFSVSAPGFTSQFGVTYLEKEHVVILKRSANLNMPFEFRISLYDAKQNGSLSEAEVVAAANIRTDATNELGKKAVDKAELFMDQGAVIKDSVGSFQVFSRKNENTVEVHATGYQNASLTLKDGEQESNHYKIYLQEEHGDFEHTINLVVKDKAGNLLAANIEGQDAAIAKDGTGVFHLYTRSDKVKIDVQAQGFQAQSVELSADKSDQSLVLEQDARKTFQIGVSSAKDKKPLNNAVVSILGNNPVAIARTDLEGLASLEAQESAKEVMIAAPGYITQTFSLPKVANEGITKAIFALRENPMMAGNFTISLQVVDESKAPLAAMVSASAGFVSQEKPGQFRILSPNKEVKVQVTAPGYENKAIDLSADTKELAQVELKKSQNGVILNTDVGDRLILSKGVVYRVVQPIDERTVRVFRRTDPTKGEFNDYPQGKMISIADFNQEIDLERNTKGFMNENVWITVYALNKSEYVLFKDSYRNIWSDYKLVYANHR